MKLLRIVVFHRYQHAWLVIASWSMHASSEVDDDQGMPSAAYAFIHASANIIAI